MVEDVEFEIEDDAELEGVAAAKAKLGKLKDELEKKFDVFPGQIKISVIREFRTESVAKYN